MAEKTKYSLTGLSLDEVSFVDRGANADADITLFKRDVKKCAMGGEVSKCEMMKGDSCSNKDCGNYTMSKCDECGGICKGPYQHVEKAPQGIQFNIGFPEDGSGSEVQSVIFDKKLWDVEKAKGWLKNHDMKGDKVDDTENTLRFRQEDPTKYAKFRMVKPGVQVAKALRASESFNQVQTLISDALRKKFQPANAGPQSYLWIRDLYSDKVVFDQDAHIYETDYTLDRSAGTTTVSLGDKAEVEVLYSPMAKSQTQQVPSDLSLRIGRLQAGVTMLKHKVGRGV